MIKIGQQAITGLSLHIVRHILVLPLRAFEAIDSSALLSALTDDVSLIANAMVGLPQLCINIPIVIACLAYTGWLAHAEHGLRRGLRRPGDRRLRDHIGARHDGVAAGT